MKKIILLIIFTFIVNQVFSQIYKPDTIIDNQVYKSYFSKQLKNPLFVTYKLYNGGGVCIRTTYHFINDSKLKTATSKDYATSGYDEGHLANSEDFAYDCFKDEKTFRFYNCLPQTANLNRGIWKHYENEIRNLSKTDSLYIITGGIFRKKQVIGDNVYVPTECFKIVQNIKTKKIIYALIFTNKQDNNTVKITTIKNIETILNLNLPISQ